MDDVAEQGWIAGWIAWYRQRDRTLSALRRAGRTAILLPTLFLVGQHVFDSSIVALFAAFGSFAMALLVGIDGDRAQRVQGQLALALAGAVLVLLGTLASQTPLLAAGSMVVVALLILFGSVISSALAAAVPALLLSFILPVSLAAPVSQTPARLLGWVLAGIGAALANAFLWPAPAVEPLRARAAGACRALATTLRDSVAAEQVDAGPETAQQRDESLARAGEAVDALHHEFVSTPYRPTGLATEARALLGLVDQLTWIQAVVENASRTAPSHIPWPVFLTAKGAVADVLDASAALLSDPAHGLTSLRDALTRLDDDLREFEDVFTRGLPQQLHGVSDAEAADVTLMPSFDRTFRLQEVAYGTTRLGLGVRAMALAERRPWWQRLLGHDPDGVPSSTAVARRRLAAHLDWRSVWLRNSVRGAVALSIATYVATASGVQHGFWVVLGTMSVLRSNALSTGQNALRAVLGTSVGFLVGAVIITVLGPHPAVLWSLLPVAILFAGVAPAAVSFAAGQAGFTVMVVILFNLIAPVGWEVGAVRVEDVVIGCAVSLAVGVLFWPRGATAMLEDALADAYDDSAAYLTATVARAADQCGPVRSAATHDALGASLDGSRSSALRLDDAFRTYLNERGSKGLALCDVASLVSGVTRLRLASDWAVELWREPGSLDADAQAVVGGRLSSSATEIEEWFDRFATTLRGRHPEPGQVHVDHSTTVSLLGPVRSALASDDEGAPWSGVRIAWTADLLDAVHLLQSTLSTSVGDRGPRS
jgi:uncharacterized membrane protein YccC